MATSSRDVKLTLSVESLGQENIAALEKELRKLATSGEQGAGKFSELADELNKLGQQNEALQSVKQLSAETDELKAKQQAAVTQVTEMTDRLEKLKVATQAAKDEQQRINKAFSDAKIEQEQAGAALRTLNAEYRGADRATAEYETKLKELVAQQNTARESVVRLRDENRNVNVEYDKAASAQNKLARQLESAIGAQEASAKAAEKSARALEEVENAAKSAGVDIDNLGRAEAELQRAFSGVNKAAHDRVSSINEMRDADKLLRVEEEALNALYRQGQDALQAEVQAQRDAERLTIQLAEAKARAVEEAKQAEIAWKKEADAILDAKAATAALAREQEVQLAVTEELLRQRAFEKQHEEAKKMLAAAEYVRAFERAIEEAERAEQALIEETKRVNDAFKTINSKPIADVELEIANVRAAMATLASSGKLTGAALSTAMQQADTKVAELELEIRKLNGTLTLSDKAANLFKNSMGQIAAGNLIADGLASVVEKVKELGRAFITTIADAERLRRGLTAVYKDSELAGQQMTFLRNAAIASGVSVKDLSGSFLKFAAATKAANIPVAETNALFLSVARAASTLGLSGEQVNGMLEALSQMASKGVVSMEELRQQLGDRLPGALSLAAQGLGITDQQLIKLVESGQLAARDLFPALTKSLQTLHGEVGGLNTTWENFKNVLVGVAQDAGDAGWVQILTGALKGLGAIVGSVAMGLSTLWEGLRLVGVGMVALAKATTDGPTHALGFFNEEAEKSIDRLAQQSKRLQAMLDPTSQAAKELAAAATANKALADNTAVVTARLGEQRNVSVNTATALKFQGEVTKILADKTTDYGAKLVQINVKSAELLKTLEAQSVAAGKQTKAVELQGQAMVTLAKLSGDVADAARAELAATNANMEAAAKEAEITKAIVEVQSLQLKNAIELNTSRGLSAEQISNETRELDNKLTKSKAEADQAAATVAKLKEEKLARELNVKTLEDNSAKLSQLKAAAELAQKALDSYRIAVNNGYGSQEELAKVQQQAAEAMRLYKDAVGDTVAAQEQLNAKNQASLALNTTKLNNEIAMLNLMAEKARAMGNEALAVEYEIRAKETQIKIIKLTAEAKKAEAQATILATEVELASLKGTDDATRAKRTQLEAILLTQKAKLEEAKASKVQVELLEIEIKNLRNGTGARQSSASAYNTETNAINANNAAREEAIAAKEKEIELDKRAEALRTRSASTELGTATGIMNFLKGAGLNEATALEITKEFLDPHGNVDYFNNRGQTKYGGKGSTISYALMKAVEQYTIGGKQQLGETATKQPSDSPTTTAPTSNKTGGTSTGGMPTGGNTGSKTVNINLNGRKSSVNVASDRDAAALTTMLRQLENDMNRS